MTTSPLLNDTQGYIAGRWVGAASGRTLEVINPATGETLARVPDMGAEETTAAVEAAAAAMRTTPSLEQRRAWLAAIASAHLENKNELASLITLENGKPLKEAAVEVEYAAGFYSHFARQLHHLEPRPLPELIRGLRWTVHHRPAGVAGLITPWNFPLAMLAKKLAAALAGGCAVVAKPAELTPLSVIALWKLLEWIGFAPGWLNLVIGRPEPIGQVFCTHPAVRVVSFTGSTAVGKRLLAQSAPHVKRLALELGGNAPFIVFADADLELAAEALIANKFRAGGQTCVCANRIFVQQSVMDAFAPAVAQRVAKLRVGDGLEEGVDIGPLISGAAFEKVRLHVEDALAHGAQCVLGGIPAHGGKAWGNYFPPTVLKGLRQPEMLAMREETFGPVIGLATFDSEEQVIAQANGTPYGLAAYVFTSSAERARRVAAGLRFGHVGINTGAGPTPEAPFGGMKESGLGREGGVEGLFEFCETQTVAEG